MFDGIGLGHRSQCPIAFGLLRIDLKGSLAVKDPTLGFPESFYEEELDQIILAQGVTSRDEYRVAPVEALSSPTTSLS
jgi:hypothetical protein